MLDFLLVLALLAVVAWFIAAPLRAGRTENSAGRTENREQRTEASDRQAVEAAKEAKYREIRDAELDYRTGKLSENDWKRIDATLRAEAMEILKREDDLTD